jgi:hypothetical protein
MLDLWNFEDYLRIHNIELTEYTRRKWQYIKLTGNLKNCPVGLFNVSKSWLATVRRRYPAAKLIRRSDTEMTFNVGTLFDTIKNSDAPPEASVNLGLLRAVMPNLIANQILGVQPMLNSAVQHLNSLRSTSADLLQKK